MYIKLGKISTVYGSSGSSDLMIFAQVPESPMTYEKPIIIRTTSALDIWFGRNFKSYSFLHELIDTNNSLWLMGPVDLDQYSDTTDYINLSEYTLDESKIYTEEPEFTDEGIKTIYQVIGEDSIERFIWYYDSTSNGWIFVNIKDLPQNIQNPGIYNRDTLTLFRLGSQIEYTNPEYRPQNSPLSIINSQSSFYFSLKGLSTERIDKGYQTLAFDVSFDGQQVLNPGEYLVLPFWNGTKMVYKVYYPSTDIDTINGIPSKFKTGGAIGVNCVGDIFQSFTTSGSYTYFYDRDKNKLYTNFPTEVNYFSTIPNFTMAPSAQDSYTLLEEVAENEDFVYNPTTMTYTNGTKVDTETLPVPALKFWSKTIGCDRSDDDNYITVQVEEINSDSVGYEYRITLRRYDYIEVFEGWLVEKEGLVRLDLDINSRSNLVGCDYVLDGIVERLPVGTWKLAGAKENVCTPKATNYALSMMYKDEEDFIRPDFHLVPDVNQFITVNNSEDPEPLSIYRTFLNISNACGCQFLIENGDSNSGAKWFKRNYILDSENKLVYFYSNITINDISRPGYYLFLTGILRDIYSVSTNTVFYPSPVDGIDRDPYNFDDTDYRTYKCNYLIDNNQKYYYREYFSGPNPTCTALMRFSQAKITRELIKNRWKFLGQTYTVDIQGSILGILDGIKNRFTIIKQIKMENYNTNLSENEISFTLWIGVNDLVESNVKLDIIINYKN